MTTPNQDDRNSAAPRQLVLDATLAPPLPDCIHGRTGRVPEPRPRVISASKRTDIPAFYLRWMLERCEAGWVDVPNPMFRAARDDARRLTHVSLRPNDVIAIVWWSKNYAVYERFHERFAAYRTQYFHFTINPRRDAFAWIEPDVPPLDEALRQVRFLASLPGGPRMVAWRYDPLCFWMDNGVARSTWDLAFFDDMCKQLSALGVNRCFTSLVDRYRKYEQRVKRFAHGITLRDPSADEVADIARTMAEIARAHGMQLFACTESGLADREGLTKGRCIDGALLHGPLRAATDQKMRGREECGCTLHTDIGDYVTQECGYSCIYCYANPNHRRFQAAARRSGAREKSRERPPF